MFRKRPLPLIYAFFALVLSGTAAQAGLITDKSETSIRAKMNGLSLFVGPTFSKGSQQARTRTGIATGIGYEIPLSGIFGLRPEILYIQKGERVSMSYLGNRIDGDMRLDYLELPILIQAKTKRGFVRPSVFAGPSIAYLISNSTLDSNGTSFPTDEAELNVKKIDYSMNMGAGLDFKLGKETDLVVNVRYIIGIADLDDSELNYKNRTWLLVSGIKF